MANKTGGFAAFQAGAPIGLILVDQPEAAWPDWSPIKSMRHTLDKHWTYLDDEVRLGAYERALKAVMRPGAVVVDLGCGTGILGMLACRAGAGRVYAIDEGEILESARAIAQANGLAGKIVHLRGRSGTLVLPELADLVICDQMGPLGFEAGLVPSFRDAALRFLRPGGQLIPARLSIWLAPAEAPAIASAITRWKQAKGGFQFDALGRTAQNVVHRASKGTCRLLAPGTPVVSFPLGRSGPQGATQGEATFRVLAPGAFHGFCGWFTAELSPDTILTNDPQSSESINRATGVLAVETNNVEAQAGDVIHVTVQVLPSSDFIGWSGTIERGGRVLSAFANNTLLSRSPATGHSHGRDS